MKPRMTQEEIRNKMSDIKNKGGEILDRANLFFEENIKKSVLNLNKIDRIKEFTDIDMIKSAELVVIEIFKDNNLRDAGKVINDGISKIMSEKVSLEKLPQLHALIFDTEIVDVNNITPIKAKKKINEMTSDICIQFSILVMEYLQLDIQAKAEALKKIEG